MNLQSIYAGPLVVDIAIAFIAIETLVLWLLYTVRGWGIAPSQYLLTVLSGLFLMLALRCALTPDGWPGMAVSLIAAGLAHGADLRQRFRHHLGP